MDAGPREGTRCGLESCHVHDFLPVTCPHCGTAFCKDHVPLDAHGCAARKRSAGIVPGTKAFADQPFKALLPDPNRHAAYEEKRRQPLPSGMTDKKRAALDAFKARVGR